MIQDWNKQSVFDHVVVAMAQQGGRSVGAIKRVGHEVFQMACSYRGEQGRKCGIGHLITDDEYTTDWEGVPVDKLYEQGLLPPRFYSLMDQKFFSDIQCAHDHSDDMNGDFENLWGSCGFAYHMNKLAADHGLSNAVLLSVFPKGDEPEQATVQIVDAVTA